MKQIKVFLFTVSAIAAILFAACGKSDEPAIPGNPADPGETVKPVEPADPGEESERTVLVYMAANNNLSALSTKDIDEMKTAADKIGSGSRLIVYQALQYKQPRLFEIMADGSERELATYPSGTASVTIAQMRRVIEDMRKAAPASGYGIVLWSHATGWINDSGTITDPDLNTPAAQPLSFGYDSPGRKRMSLRALAQAIDLGDMQWDFIYFDCCHMATVEVAYQLRHLTPVIAASPTELGEDGMPYDRNLQHFFSPEPDLEAAARNTFTSYTDGSVSPSYGCAISVIRTSALDRLADACAAIHSSGAILPENYQRVPYFRTIIMSSGLYDMFHYYSSLEGVATDLKDEFTRAFNAAVSLSLTTQRVYGLAADNFHGLATNIVTSDSDITTYRYDETDWYADVLSK